MRMRSVVLIAGLTAIGLSLLVVRHQRLELHQHMAQSQQQAQEHRIAKRLWHPRIARELTPASLDRKLAETNLAGQLVSAAESLPRAVSEDRAFAEVQEGDVEQRRREP